MEAPIVGRARERLAYYVTLLHPLPLIRAPNCDLTAESHTRSDVPLPSCCNVMTSKSMRFFKRLGKWKLEIGGRIDFYGRRAGARQYMA